MSRVAVSINILFLALAACVPNQRIMNSAEPAAPANVAPARSSFEQDVESMRTADFQFIYVFRRKDGAPLDADDTKFAAQNIPVQMNRRTRSDEDKAIIVGSNYRMPNESVAVLSERFVFQDLSPPNATEVPPSPAR